MPSTKEKLLTLDEFCEYLNIGKTVAYKMVRTNEIKALKFSSGWRIPKSAVDKLIEDKLAEQKGEI